MGSRPISNLGCSEKSLRAGRRIAAYLAVHSIGRKVDVHGIEIKLSRTFVLNQVPKEAPRRPIIPNRPDEVVRPNFYPYERTIKTPNITVNQGDQVTTNARQMLQTTGRCIMSEFVSNLTCLANTIRLRGPIPLLFEHVVAVEATHLTPGNRDLLHPPPHGTHLPCSPAVVLLGE